MSIAEHLANAERPLLTMELAARVAPVPDEVVLAFAKLSPKVNENAAMQLLLDLFDYQRTIAPVGWLHLERIEMYPIGVERGELVFTVPMAPGETATISPQRMVYLTRIRGDRRVTSRVTAGMTWLRRPMRRCPWRTKPGTRAPINFGALDERGYGGVSRRRPSGYRTTWRKRSLSNSRCKEP
jgi:hypothetical protein